LAKNEFDKSRNKIDEFTVTKEKIIMPVLIKIPSPLRGLTDGQKSVEAEGKTVSEVFQNLDAKYPGFRDKLFDKKTLRLLIHIYLNNQDIRVLNKTAGSYEIDLDTPVKNGDQLSLIPPIAGGTKRCR
jgi:molybdopterin converting factor small subunit